MLAGLKRSRDHEEEENDHYNDSKKLRTLPFRSSPTSQHATPSFSNRSRSVPRLRVLTPLESSEDESDCDLLSPKDNAATPALSLYLRDVDEDIDMDISDSFDQPIWSPKVPDSAFASSFPMSARSSLSINTPATRSSHASTPRIPTPIYGHFSSPSYPGDLSPPSAAMSPPSYINTLSFPRIRGPTDVITDTFLRRRALPSPIREDENMESPTTTMSKSLLSDLKMTAIPIKESMPFQDMLTPDTPGTKNWANLISSTHRSRRRSDAISGDNWLQSRFREV